MNSYSRRQWREDAQIGLLMALGIGAISALPLGFLALANLWRASQGQPLELPWREYLALVAAVWASYLVAGQLGAVAYFMLRPARRWVLGWAATGAALAVSIYGTVGYMLAIFYEPVGRIILEDSTRAEAWEVARFGTRFFAAAGALFGVYHAWRIRTGRAARDAAM